MNTECTCDPGDYYQPPARDPQCPRHGYPEEDLEDYYDEPERGYDFAPLDPLEECN